MNEAPSPKTIREATQEHLLREQGSRSESLGELFIATGIAIVLLALIGFVLYAAIVGIGRPVTDLLLLLVLASVLAA